MQNGTELFAEIVTTLKEKAELKQSGHLVKPVEDNTFSIWHVSTADETQMLTLEIEWYNEMEEDNTDEAQQEIPEIT